MAKKLDPQLLDILTTYGERPEDALWDCHGVWVAYHKAIERIAAKAGIVFDMPQIIEADSAGKTVAIAVRGTMGDRAEWSFGEASPFNNKNAYPYSMAEKRGKDRVVLKLVGLHGMIYSEEESDDFKVNQVPKVNAPKTVDTQYGEVDPSWQSDEPRASAASVKKAKTFDDFKLELLECTSPVSLARFANEWRKVAKADRWPDGILASARELIEGQRTFILGSMSPEALAEVPLKDALEQSIAQHPIRAG